MPQSSWFLSAGLLTPPSSPPGKHTLSPVQTQHTPARSEWGSKDFDTTVIRFSDGLEPPLTPPPSASKLSLTQMAPSIANTSPKTVMSPLRASAPRKTPFGAVGTCKRYVRLSGVREDLDQMSLQEILGVSACPCPRSSVSQSLTGKPTGSLCTSCYHQTSPSCKPCYFQASLKMSQNCLGREIT